MPPTCETCAAHDQTMSDLREIRASQQRTEVAVGRILGYLNLNGGGEPHPHHRDHEEADRLHQRATDAIAAAEAASDAAHKAVAAVTANRNADDLLPALPKWVVAGLAALVLLVITLAMIAGERGLPFVPKPAAAPAPLVVPR